MANPFVSKDGSKHTNHDSMKRADARYSAKQPQAAAGDFGSDAEDGSGDEPQDGASMAAEHGPAIETTVKHDHEAGSHSVHAVHPDGHEHDSEHASAQEAHQYAADCAGAGDSGQGGGF